MGSYYIKLGELIREKRLKKNLSTQELANILNVSIGFISNLENGKTDTFNIELASNLCKTLEISPLNFLPESNIDINLDDMIDDKHLHDVQITVKEIISTNITTIITNYMKIIKSHNYDATFMNKITDKILTEMHFLNDFKLK